MGSKRLAMSGPAAGLAKWTGRRLAEALVAEEVVEIISGTTVHTTLKKRAEALAVQGLNMPRGSVEWGTPNLCPP